MLNGHKVGLRAIEEQDLDQLLAWRNRPELRRYFREYRELNHHQQQLWFNSKVNNDPGTRMFSIVELGSGRLLGACGLCYIDWVNRSADFSIYLGADELYIDEVLAIDAARVMIRYAYDELALHRLWSEIYDFDEPKKAFFKTLGFQLDGRHRQTHWAEGAWHDSLFFGLLATDAAAAG
ncbi:GNAT family N-acetyltransferase [Herbaspirillum frisingense]|uniref:GNAT family N-acetyltransferase n=1 Tax=Herbaspirillum frisingense TaxID=92645 RepID=UPI0039B0389D